MPKFKKLTGDPLKIACIIGLALGLVISWGMVIFILVWGKNAQQFDAGGNTVESGFARELKNYDLFNAPQHARDGENPSQIEKRLYALQKKALGVEQTLSALKRWRALALIDRYYSGGYEKAAREAAGTYTASGPLAAVAADALVLGGEPLSDDKRNLLKTYAARLTQDRFDLLKLSLYALAGSLEDPSYVGGTPDGVPAALFSAGSAGFAGMPVQLKQDLQIDDFLIRAAQGDIPGASYTLNSLLSSNTPEITRMGAEFYYDNDNPLRAGELFSRLTGGDGPDQESDYARMADSLALAGEIPGARNIWLALVSGNGSTQTIHSTDAIYLRSLYNLAAVSADTQEEKSWLERLFSRLSQPGQSPAAGGINGIGDIKTYSTIRYTRLMDAADSIAALEQSGSASPSPAQEPQKLAPLVDLELLRRKLETWTPKRAAAEVWLLLGRNSGSEPLYEWAAWYFDRQKLYGETDRLLIEAARQKMSGDWLDLHRGLALVRQGKIDDGEKILKDLYARKTGVPGRGVDWRIPANLGQIQESRGAISSALDYYQTAAQAIQAGQDPGYLDSSDAARIQMRISRCLEGLGRADESRGAMEAALKLDPDNINIRSELRRLNNR